MDLFWNQKIRKMKKQENVAAAKNATENGFRLVYYKESVYEHGFFKKMAKAGKDDLVKFLKEWTKEIGDEFDNDNEVLKILEIIYKPTFVFLTMSLLFKNQTTSVVPVAGDYFFGYDLDKDKSVFKFQILKRK